MLAWGWEKIGAETYAWCSGNKVIPVGVEIRGEKVALKLEKQPWRTNALLPGVCPCKWFV